MAREDAEEGRRGGEQAHTAAHIPGSQTGHDGTLTAAYGWEESGLDETKEEYEKRIGGYAEAIRYFLDHPEAPLHPVTRAFIESIRDEIGAEKSETRRQSKLN